MVSGRTENVCVARSIGKDGGMTEISDRYRRAAAVFTEQVEAVPEDRWTSPSPCDDWDARGVVEHMASAHNMFLGFVDQSVRTIGVGRRRPARRVARGTRRDGCRARGPRGRPRRVRQPDGPLGVRGVGRPVRHQRPARAQLGPRDGGRQRRDPRPRRGRDRARRVRVARRQRAVTRGCSARPSRCPTTRTRRTSSSPSPAATRTPDPPAYRPPSSRSYRRPWPTQCWPGDAGIAVWESCGASVSWRRRRGLGERRVHEQRVDDVVDAQPVRDRDRDHADELGRVAARRSTRRARRRSRGRRGSSRSPGRRP